MSEFLSNQDESLAAAMERWLGRATSAKWAVAYVRTSIITRLSRALDNFERRGGRLQILTGDGQGITQADGLELLQSMRGVEVHIYAAPRVTFHPKLYLFRNGEQGAIVGSANLSDGAFSSNLEVAAEITSVTDAAFIERAARWFDNVWRQSTPLTTAMLQWFRDNERPSDQDGFARLVREEAERYGTETARREWESLFELNRVYSNGELSRAAHVSTQGGIRYTGSASRSVKRCIVVTGSEKAEYYADEFNPDRTSLKYFGEGRNDDQEMTRGNRVLSLQSQQGFPLHVFLKLGVDRYQYAGQFRVTGYDTVTESGEDGSARQVYVFSMELLR